MARARRSSREVQERAHSTVLEQTEQHEFGAADWWRKADEDERAVSLMQTLDPKRFVQ